MNVILPLLAVQLIGGWLFHCYFTEFLMNLLLYQRIHLPILFHLLNTP